MTIYEIKQNSTENYLKALEEFSLRYEATLTHVQGLALSTVKLFSPWFVPLTPAGFAGFEIWQVTSPTMPQWLAVSVSVAAALGLETVGASVSHTTLELYENGEKSKFWLGSSLVLSYVVIGISIVLMLKYAPIEVIGAGAFGLALISYIGMALSQDAKNASITRRKADEKSERLQEIEFERQQNQADYDYQLALAQIEADAKVNIERVKAEEETNQVKAVETTKRKLAQASIPQKQASNGAFKCDCGREFGTPQALGAHKRFCKKETE